MGYKNWKKALDKSKGFMKHENTVAHKINVSKWHEYCIRVNENSSVSTQINESVLEKHRYYVSSIFDIVRFIVAKELPLRGYDEESHNECGIFQSLFEYTLKKDTRLQECYKIIPKNASYLSPEIQNEMIALMSSCVKEHTVSKVKMANIPFYTVMMDGTRDKNNQEAISICIRYVKDGVPTESLLSIENSHSLKADSLTDLIFNVLENNGLDPNQILSQCYDGASVMSGSSGGVQALLQQKLKKNIPYVHCFNHQLHLIVVHITSDVPEVRQVFDYCRVIHQIFSTFKFKTFYEGSATSRLMEQRWTGHLKTAEAIRKNYQQMLQALNSALSEHVSNLSGDEIVEYRGLLTMMKTLKFRFTLLAILRVLRSVEPADAILQKKQTGLASAIPVILTVFTCLKEYRSDTAFLEVFEESKQLYGQEEEEADVDEPEVQQVTKTKRRRIPNKNLDGFFLTQSSGLYSDNDSATRTTSTSDASRKLRQIFFNIFDRVINEFEKRFFENQKLYKLLDSVSNLKFESIDADLQELRLFNITVPTKEEIFCVKRYLEQKELKNEEFFTELYNQRVAFRETYEMMAAIATFGCSSAMCEASFSFLSRILSPFRQRMTFARESNLTVLACERKALESISNEMLLKKFNTRLRRLQLY